MMVRIGPQPGMICALLALASLVLHEFAHIFAGRATGGYGDEILISPFGGLARVHPGGTFLSRLVVPASGPIVNLAVCAALVPLLISQEQSVSGLMNPFKYGEIIGAFDDATPIAVMAAQLGFIVNWLLVLINLIPVHPLDGGRMLQAFLSEQYGAQVSNGIYLKVGTIAGFVFLIAGLMFNSAMVVAIGAFVLLMNMEETYRMRTVESYDDSFMGYDFSQGYTSLEREEGSEKEQGQAKLGPFARWKLAREERREQLELERNEEAEQQLDAILARLHEVGYDSLTEQERRTLKRASNKFKNRQDGT